MFVGPGFETDLARNGVVVDTFPGAPGGLTVDLFAATSILVGHGDASGVVSRYDPASGLSNPVLALSEIVEDVAVNSTGDIYTTSEIPNGPGSDTRLRENGAEADVLPGAPGGLAVVPLPRARRRRAVGGVGTASRAAAAKLTRAPRRAVLRDVRVRPGRGRTGASGSAREQSGVGTPRRCSRPRSPW